MRSSCACSLVLSPLGALLENLAMTIANGKQTALEVNKVLASADKKVSTVLRQQGTLLGQSFGTVPVSQKAIDNILSPFLADFTAATAHPKKLGRHLGEYLLGAVNAELCKAQGEKARIVYWYQVGSGTGNSAKFYAEAQTKAEKKTAPKMTKEQKEKAEKELAAKQKLANEAAALARKEAAENEAAIPAIDKVFTMVRGNLLSLADLETVIATITAERLAASLKNEQSKTAAKKGKTAAEVARKADARKPAAPRKVAHNVSHAEANAKG